MAQNVELFLVQMQLAPPDEDLPDGVWNSSKELHGGTLSAETEIVAARAMEVFVHGEQGTFRIVKLLGEVSEVFEPKQEEE